MTCSQNTICVGTSLLLKAPILKTYSHIYIITRQEMCHGVPVHYKISESHIRLKAIPNLCKVRMNPYVEHLSMVFTFAIIG